MTLRSLSVALVAVAALQFAAQTARNPTHLDFSLVRGSVGYVPSQAGGIMTLAPFTVLSFTGTNEHRTLVVSDSVGDFTAVLQPGHYCVLAYDIKTGDVISLDSRQVKCIEIEVRKDVRLDVILGNVR
jgi:hypothetical protein